VNRDSGTASANGGWLRRLVRRLVVKSHLLSFERRATTRQAVITMADRTPAVALMMKIHKDTLELQRREIMDKTPPPTKQTKAL
jgi:hypothetical protein